jgi:hypothetical protein
MAYPYREHTSLPDDDYGYETDSDSGDRYPESSDRRRRRLENQGTLGRMSSWLHNHAGSHQTQLAATAVLSGAAVAGAIFGYQAVKRQEAVRELKDSIPDVNERHRTEKVSR